MKLSKWNIVIIPLSLIILISCIFLVDSPEHIINALKSANLVWLFYALCCIFLYWFTESTILRYVCNRLTNKITIFTGFRTTMMGQLFNCITPAASGGQPSQIIMLMNHNIPFGDATCVVVTKFIVYQITLSIYSCVLILLKLPFFISKVSNVGYLVLIGFTVHIVIVLLLIGIGFFPNITKIILYKLTYLLNKIKIIKNYDEIKRRIDTEHLRFYENLTGLKKDLRLFILPAFLTIIQLTLFYMIPYFVCMSLGITPPSVFVAICGTAFVTMISSFVPLPGGTGGAEGGFYLFFHFFFPNTGLLTVAIILWRLFTFYLPILFGLLFAKFEKVKV